MELEELIKSGKEVGQLLPVLKNKKGEIVDGYHRKRANPNWKEVILPIDEGLDTLKARVHLNALRRDVPSSEKEGWVKLCRELLQAKGLRGFQWEIAEELGLTRQWVSKYDPEPIQPNISQKEQQRSTSVVLNPETKIFTYEPVEPPPLPEPPQPIITPTTEEKQPLEEPVVPSPEEPEQPPEKPEPLYNYNVWGFRDDSWRGQIVRADPNQPDVEFYHGATPAFVIHQLVQMFNPEVVLDSMAGTGTVGYVCKQYNIPCDQYDIYPYPKYGVLEGDAEFVGNGKKYDLIFNHPPYWQMVKYGGSLADLSTMKQEDFQVKLARIFQHNYELLNPGGIYAVLVGDWRHGGKIIPLTALMIMMGADADFVFWDEAIKLTGEMKGKRLQEYRAAQYGYLAQTYDTVLMFRKEA